MRSMWHIATLIAAIVVGPSAWILLAFGQDRSADVFAEASRSGTFRTEDFVGPLLLLVGAGLLLGILVTLRFSPLGATVIGIAYTSSYTLLLIAPKGTLDLLSSHLSVGNRHADLTTPIRTGTTVVLGLLLLAAALNIGRRRRGPTPATAYEAARDDRGIPVVGMRTDPDRAVRYVTRPEPDEADSYAPHWSSSVQGTNEYHRW
jgi:hypothetical protein